MVNRLGSGVVQNHALAPFTASLFRRVLGEDALLPDVRTLWLGDPEARATALAQPERWSLLEATERNDPGEPANVLTGPLSAAARAGSRRPAGHGGTPVGRGRAGPPRHHANLRGGPAGAGPVRAARLRRGRPGRLPRPARRARPARGRAQRRHAAQRLRQQGPLDHLVGARAPAGQHPALDHAGGASAPDGSRPAQPDHGQSVLARALCRARRRDHARCCAACWRGSSRTGAPTAIPRCCSACCACSCARVRPCPRSPRSPAGTASRSWSAS